MLSEEEEEQGKDLNDQPAPPPYAVESTKRYDQQHWDHLHGLTALLRERLQLAQETTLELIDRRYQLAQNHQDLRLQRQRLLSKQAAYLQDIPPF